MTEPISTASQSDEMTPERFAELATWIEAQVGTFIVGQQQLVRQTFITLVAGSHALKAGFYYQNSYKPQSIFGSFNTTVNFVDNASNPFDTGYAYANAATGVFISGGSQLRLSQLLPGSPLGDALHRAHDRGCVVGGTSAGASIMSDFMISMGEEGVTPRQRASQLTAGLGLLPGVVVDQHFDQRSRYGRLL